MPGYVAFLRGVSPMNAKMAQLKRCFQGAGFTDVKTVLSSGNVIFDTSAKSNTTLAHEIEAAMVKQLGRTFYTIVRATSHLHELIEGDPYSAFVCQPTRSGWLRFCVNPTKQSSRCHSKPMAYAFSP